MGFKHLLVYIAFILLTTAALAKPVRYSGLEQLSSSQQTKVKQWVEHGVQAVEQTLGPLSQPYIPVLLKPRYIAFEPVPWGQVIRGNDTRPDGIELEFSRYASLNKLKSDWTLYHELSHLYHPLLVYRDFWLSEGLATFMQLIVMRNSGVISHQNMHMRFKAGLQRGKQNTKEITGQLQFVSADMWSLNAYQRVYWSGVAFFIEAQNKLIMSNAKYKSIAELLKQYHQCCHSQGRQTGYEFVRGLDKFSRSSVFSSLYAKYRSREDFPKIENTLILAL